MLGELCLQVLKKRKRRKSLQETDNEKKKKKFSPRKHLVR